MFFLADPIELVSVYCSRWPFTLQLKNHHAIVMTCREEVDFRMCSNHPTESASVLRLLITDMIGRLGDSQTIVLSFEALFRVSIHRVGNFEGHREYLYGSPLVQIPNPHSFVLTY